VLIEEGRSTDIDKISPKHSPAYSRRDISYTGIENKDNLFADVKKKRQNVLSNHSSKSTEGFKL
jgi:hypothetical protein